jgi:multimeric flavodoxin WrbA
MSPRKRGNTGRIVEAILEGARGKGAETESIHFGGLKVQPCNSCGACQKTGECNIKDDMLTVYKALKDADAIIFASPIFFDHITAQAKTFIDRLYSFYWKKTLDTGKKAVVTINYEWNKPEIYDGVAEWISKRLSDYHGIETIATLKVHDTVERPVKGRPEVFSEARSIGEKIATLKN